MVNDFRSEPRVEISFGERHSGGIGNALSKRSGRRLDAGTRIELGMALAVRAKFPEALDLVDRYLLVAGEVEKRIQQHRAMTVRHHDAIPVKPQRVLWVELQMSREERGRRLG